jgi:hypothetical protein
MNVNQWYYNSAKSANLTLPYNNWKDFGIQVITVDSLPISVDFGDGNIQSVPGNNTQVLYSRATAETDAVIIFNANRLTQIDFRSGGIYNPNWNFSLAVFRVANNLLSIDFRSGNIFGDAGNLSPVLQVFQVLNPSFGAMTNLSNLPSTLLRFNQTSPNANYLFTGSEIEDEMPNLQNFTIAGKSKVEMSLADLPQYLTTIEISNFSPFTTANRRNRITYAPFTVGVPLAGTNVTNMLRFVIDCENGFGFNSAELDDILIYLASLTWNAVQNKLIRLSLGHGVRTSASDAAVATLTALTNMTLQLN